MHEPTWSEVQAQQGTRKDERNPWDTYGEQMDRDPEMTPELEAAIADYASRVREETKSSETQEELARQKELSAETAKEYQWVTPDEYKDVPERMGRVLHSSEFISMLRKAGIQCWYRDHPQPKKITLVVKREGQEPEVGCWAQIGFMPELSVMAFDSHGVPLAEKFRGWRTCLLQLILKGLITEDYANRVFGPPNVTEAYTRYNSVLKSFRDHGSRLED